MFNLLLCIVNYIFVGSSVSPHLKMGVLDARDFIRKILEKEMSKSGGRAELVKVPPERRPSKESLDRLNRDVEGLVRMTGNQVGK